MEFGIRDTLLTVGPAVGFLAGIALVLLGSATIATLGILLVVLSAIAFIVDVKDLLVKTDRDVRK